MGLVKYINTQATWNNSKQMRNFLGLDNMYQINLEEKEFGTFEPKSQLQILENDLDDPKRQTMRINWTGIENREKSLAFLRQTGPLVC